MFNKFIRQLIKPLLPIKLYSVGGSGSGSFYGLSNLKNLDLSNLFNTSSQAKSQSNIDLANASKNQGYSRDTRTGTISNRGNETYNLDTSEYDTKLKQLQDETNKYYWYSINGNIITNMQDSRGGAADRAQYDAWRNSINNQISSLQSNKEAYLKQNANNNTLSSAQTIADQSLRSGQASAQQEAKANAAANANTGINKSAAGLLGSQASSTDSASTANNLYASNRNTQASTQADYLQKMAQADALDQQAKNVNKSGDLAALGALFGGAASGASVGASLANTSDENEKEAPDSDLFEMVEQFKKLYEELQELRGTKK